jgi:hypothetical protein
MRPSGRRVADLKGRVDRDFSVDPALPVGIGRMALLDVPGRGGRIDAFDGGRVETDLGSQLRPQLGHAIPPPRAGGATPMVVDSAADRLGTAADPCVTRGGRAGARPRALTAS